MKDTKCELVRRELDELMLNEEFSTIAAEHLQTCVECREFQRRQTKLRQIVGSLGPVNAPADFDFRLRARLAADSQESRFHYWSFASKGLATAAVLLVFGVGVVVVWQRAQQEIPVAVLPQIDQSVREPEPDSKVGPEKSVDVKPIIAVNALPRRNAEPPSTAGLKGKRPLVAVDFSNTRANVISSSTGTETTDAVFPIETSLQSMKVSLDDGRGNARVISVPTVSFGSQRVLATGNQFAPKGVW